MPPAIASADAALVVWLLALVVVPVMAMLFAMWISNRSEDVD